jgi:hypothetical protein
MIAWSSNRYAQDAWPFKVIDCHGGGDDRRQASDGHSEYETAHPILSGSSKGDNVGDPAPFAHKPRALPPEDNSFQCSVHATARASIQSAMEAVSSRVIGSLAAERRQANA